MMYAFFDGDNIGDTIEILLIENRIQEAKAFSETIESTMKELKHILDARLDTDIIICGGDDLLIKFSLLEYDKDVLELIRNIFRIRTGHTMSCGVGEDISQVVRNLHLAKLYGKNRVKEVD